MIALVVRLSEPSIGEMLARIERERLRERGVLVWLAREAQV